MRNFFIKKKFRTGRRVVRFGKMENLKAKEIKICQCKDLNAQPRPIDVYNKGAINP